MIWINMRFLYVTLALILAMVLINGCWSRKVEWMGYIDSSKLNVSAPSQGFLEAVHVHVGDFVDEKTLLAEVYYEPDTLQIEAKKNLIRSEMLRFQDKLMGRFLPSNELELTTLQNNIQLAHIEDDRALLHFKRMTALLKTNAVSIESWESAKAKSEQAAIHLHQAQLDFERYILGSSEYVDLADYFKIQSSMKDLAMLESKQSSLQLYAPHDAYVASIELRQGAWVNAGSPVISLGLVPYYVVFFASAKEVASLKLGHHVTVEQMNGQKSSAVVTYVNEQAVFTPPIVYADGDCDEYRYRIEATLQDSSLHPGQPVKIVWRTQ